MVRSLKSRLDRHFVACSAAAAAATVAALPQQSAEAAIVYSGVVNLAIPGNIDGIYLNVQTGLTGSSGAGTAGWDINPYFGGNTFFAAAPGYGTVANGTNVAVLAAGTMIDGTNATALVTNGSLYPTVAPGGFYGFRFQDGAAAVRYGWAEIIRGSTTTTAGTIVRYAYEDSGAGIAAGAVPTPGTLALLALGAVGLAGRRRR